MARKSSKPAIVETPGPRSGRARPRSNASGKFAAEQAGSAPMREAAAQGTLRETEAKRGGVVRARIDPAVKDEASAVLATMGLTLSDAFRLLMMRVATEKVLPFSPLVPNEETIAAMRAARRGEVEAIDSIDALFADLDAED